eukprot:5902924-Amphidinium_carterae.1
MACSCTNACHSAARPKSGTYIGCSKDAILTHVNEPGYGQPFWMVGFIWRLSGGIALGSVCCSLVDLTKASCTVFGNHPEGIMVCSTPLNVVGAWRSQ